MGLSGNVLVKSNISKSKFDVFDINRPRRGGRALGCPMTRDSARAPGTACGGDRYMGSNRPRRGGRALGCPMTGDSARAPGTACGGRTALYCRSGPP